MNNKGLELLKTLEGCCLTAYKLKGETNYTIGYGHSDKNIKKDSEITQAQADELLKKDLEKFEKYVTNYAVKKFPELNENQVSALVSYCYNRGLGGLKQLVNNSNSITEMGNNIVVYWGSNKNYQTALINRRKKEQKLFFENVSRETLVVPSPLLKRGSKGVQVKHLQEFLNSQGANLKIDGIFGTKTYEALYDFQRLHLMCGTPDGVYGVHTFSVVRNIIRG